MFNKLAFLYKHQYRINLTILFLISFLVFQPILKYSEYVLNFPRVNFSIFVFILFFLYLISISDMFSERYNFDLLLSLWLILFISGIQILSMPWAIYYGSNGFEIFLKIISKTFFCYWMFWFAGLHINNILNHKRRRPEKHIIYLKPVVPSSTSDTSSSKQISKLYK